MLMITAQTEISMRITLRKVGNAQHFVALNLIAPNVGVVVDGHHDYMAALIDHHPIKIVIADLHHSAGKTSKELLDYWSKTVFGRRDWEFWDLHTNRLVSKKTLLELCKTYPNYHYTLNIDDNGKVFYE